MGKVQEWRLGKLGAEDDGAYISPYHACQTVTW